MNWRMARNFAITFGIALVAIAFVLNTNIGARTNAALGSVLGGGSRRAA